MLIQVSRVESVDQVARKVNILILTRPGAEDVGFRGTRRAYDDEEEHEERDVEEEEEMYTRETVDFDTILAGQWRFVNV